MDVKTALAERKSTRAFLDKEVPIDVINTIIEQAKTAPSGNQLIHLRSPCPKSAE